MAANSAAEAAMAVPPAQPRHKPNRGRSNSIASASELGDPRPGSAPQLLSLGVAGGWTAADGATHVSFGMPYAFYTPEAAPDSSGAATAPVPAGAEFSYLSTPFLLQNGAGGLQYLAWAPYAAQQQQPRGDYYSRKPPRNYQGHGQQQQAAGGGRGRRRGGRSGPADGPQLRHPQQQQQPGGRPRGGGDAMRPSRSAANLVGYPAAAGAGSDGDPLPRASIVSASAPASPEVPHLAPQRHQYRHGGLRPHHARQHSAGGSAGSGGGGGGGRQRHHHARYPSSSASLDSLPPLMERSDDAPDLERFLKAATPVVRHRGGAAAVAALRLADLWRFYEQPSVFGLECAALGGPRGPSSCYFVPYLSAVHLYRPAEAEEGGEEGGEESETFSFPQGLDSWPPLMRRAFSWAAAEHVADRLPLQQRLAELAAADGAADPQAHALWATRLTDLHPYSWFSVAWYPLYRIPDAPLTARFLTFHSLAPLWEAATAAEREVREAAEAAAAAERSAAGAAGAAAGAVARAASYKMMLESGSGGGGAASAGAPGTPAASAPASTFPASLSAGSSDAAAMDTGSGPGSACTAVTAVTAASTAASGAGGAAGRSVASGPASASDCVSMGPSYGSLSPSPAASDSGDDRPGALGGLGSSARCSLAAPAVGLCWHTAGSAVGENWTDTLVALEVPEDPFGRGLRRGDVLPGPGNASVAAVGPRAAVIRKDYPVAKGGPLSWEIQLEELEEGARRLALRQGLVRARPAAAAASAAAAAEEEEDQEPQSCCPDYDFFSSRRR